jgi:hypothetical protein
VGDPLRDSSSLVAKKLMQIDVNYRTEPPRLDGAYREEPEGSPKDFSVFSTKQISVFDILIVEVYCMQRVLGVIVVVIKST